MSAPDVLSLVVAAHVWQATPGINFNASPNARDALGFRDWIAAVVSRWQDRVAEWAPYASPWWPADRVTVCTVCTVCLTHSDSMHRRQACADARWSGQECGEPGRALRHA